VRTYYQQLRARGKLPKVASRKAPTTRPTIASNTITRISPLDVRVSDGAPDATNGGITGVAMVVSTSAAGRGNFDCAV
jgi:hypothetical protein